MSVRARRSEKTGGAAAWIGVGALLLAGAGLWFAWKHIATPGEKEKDPGLGCASVEIPFDGIDQQSADDRFVMTIEVVAEKGGGLLPEGLADRLLQCDAFARDSLATEYPDAAGRQPIVRLQFSRWPSEDEWKTLTAWVRQTKTIAVEVVGSTGQPRLVKKQS